MQNISTILLDMYGVILEESKGNFIPYVDFVLLSKQIFELTLERINKRPSECILADVLENFFQQGNSI